MEEIDLMACLDLAMEGRQYRHYKGDVYIVRHVSRHHETGEPYVVYYKKVTPNDQSGLTATFIRPLKEWMEYVNPQNNIPKCRRFTALH